MIREISVCSKDILIVYTKSKTLESCSLAMDDSVYMLVSCFVPENSIQKSLSVIKDGFFVENLEFVDVSKCERYCSDEWNDGSEKSQEINEFAQKARGMGKFQFDFFSTQHVGWGECFL